MKSILEAVAISPSYSPTDPFPVLLYKYPLVGFLIRGITDLQTDVLRTSTWSRTLSVSFRFLILSSMRLLDSRVAPD